MIVTLSGRHHPPRCFGDCVLGELLSFVRSPKKVVLDLKYVDQELENEYLLQSALILAQIKGNDTVTRVLQRVSRESADSSIHLKKIGVLIFPYFLY